MRFLEFVFWCGYPTQRSEAQTATSSQPFAEDEGSLVPLSAGTRHRKKRGRLITATAATEWRPSLGSISEDNMVQQRERSNARNRKVEPEREVKRRNADGSGAASKARHRNYGDDHKRVAVATVMPAFSPTPFMF
ncbi:uncharacterized protein LOC114720297 isoform X1 [Neltuma alba]|uniref:uncharacterized protein LOC114720297 isoform X1 n=1 Tax=Neltuma alba TaxID=207710 RepID=UPI0010A504E1|nr:uncharacterized protein LOC114720297 isoform X1 [Prosopis alba]XP_028761765.1 uncharacterized protein LOC114720297 isoform X1 [Prosopis alba]